MPTGKKRPDTSFKLSRDHVDRARELSEFASRRGWSALDVDRGDPPTIKAVVEAAIDALYERMSPGRK